MSVLSTCETTLKVFFTNKRVREIIRPNSEIRTDFPENLVLMTVENSTQNCITAHPIVYFRLYGTYDQMS